VHKAAIPVAKQLNLPYVDWVNFNRATEHPDELTAIPYIGPDDSDPPGS